MEPSDEVKPKVLVVDDSAFIGEATQAMLVERGIEVRLASTVATMNALLVAWSPTLVLLDVNMPGIEGTDICRWIKERAPTKGTPVVLFSDMPEKDLARLVAGCDADGFVSKRRGLQVVADHVAALCEEMIW